MSNWPASKSRRVLAALERISWRLKRQRGSHRVLTCLGWPEYEFTFHEFLRHKQVAGGTVSQSKMGFGAHQSVHSMDAPDAGELAPLCIEFIDSAEHVEELLPSIYDIVTDGLIEVQDTTIVKSVRKGGAPAPRRPYHKVKGPAKLMRVFLGEADTWHEEPLYEAIVKRLRMLDIAGATVYRGILGYGAKGHQHKESTQWDTGLIVTSEVRVIRLQTC